MDLRADLSGRVALVTAASRKLGAEIARQLANHGVDVAINYLESEAAAKGLCAELSVLGVRAVPVKADVSKPDQVSRLVEETITALSPIDILVNNDGNFKETPFLHTLGPVPVIPSVAPRLSVADSTIAELKSSVLVIDLGDTTGAAAINGIDFQVQEGATPLAQLTVTATSGDPAMIAPTDLNLQRVGDLWNLKITPSGIGMTDITVSVNDGTYSDAYAINVIVMPPGPVGSRLHYGMADASAAIAIGGGQMLVAGDERVGDLDGLRAYDRAQPGRALGAIDFSAPSGLFREPVSELDLEGSLVFDFEATSWWIGSSSNNKDGKCRPNRHGLYQVDLFPIVRLVRWRRDIRDEFYTWDRANLHRGTWLPTRVISRPHGHTRSCTRPGTSLASCTSSAY